MNTMPRIDKTAVPTQSDEEKAILDIIVKSDGSLLASKPHRNKQIRVKDATSPYGYTYQCATEQDRLRAKAAYTWRMVVFAVSQNPKHHCMPVMAFCDLDGESDARRSTEKALDDLAERLIRAIPADQQHGTIRWGRALGYIR